MAQSSAPQAAMPMADATLAQRLLALFPLLLFMPQGVVNGGLALYLVLLALSGDWRARLASLRAHPLLAPALAMLFYCALSGLLLERSEDFRSGFVHYQDYLILFLFMAAGPGAWQRQAVRVLYLGASVAAALLFLARAGLLPTWSFFSAYNLYSGNKSILIALLLAVTACWLLAAILQARQRDWKAIANFVFLALAVVLVARSRTAQLILLLGVAGLLLAAMRNWRQRLAVMAGIALLAVAALQIAPTVAQRLQGTVADLLAFANGAQVSRDGQRIEIYGTTLGMIAEKPLTGFGVGAWYPNFKLRMQGSAETIHSTPHNDYLLYLSELGLSGLLLLLWAFWVQAAQCRRLAPDMSARLAILTMALVVGALFNAILRDFAFAFPFMFLLAIPLTGLSRARTEP